MILIADSGSTKTEWRLVNRHQNFQSCYTSGINPFYQSTDEILLSLKNEFTLDKDKVENIYFYGAGCANEEKNEIVAKALTAFFECEIVEVNSDLLAAARALCKTSPGISCILGTGSNSCLYDGNKIIENVSPLGYILGDEGSGAVLGKLLIADLLKKQLPTEIEKAFYSEYNLSPQEIMNAVYKESFPNRFLAQFTHFIHRNIHTPSMKNIVLQSFKEFINRNILQYNTAKNADIHFTGSIAYHFKKQLTTVLNQYSLKLGKVTISPMDDLIDFHTSVFVNKK